MQQINDFQQFKQVVDRAQKILLTTVTNPPLGTVTALLALGIGLEEYGKKVNFFSEGLLPQQFSFLPRAELLNSQLGPRSLCVAINYGREPVEKINYDNKEGRFEVYLTPFRGQFSPQQIEISYSGLDYDLIITLGAQQRVQLGRWTTDYASFLRQALIVNLDNSSENSLFGKINLVDAQAQTLAQLAYDSLKALGIPLEQEKATLLLAAVLEATQNMRQPSPRLLRFSATLLDKKADWAQARQWVEEKLVSSAPVEEPASLPAATKTETKKTLLPLAQQKNVAAEDNSHAPQEQRLPPAAENWVGNDIH